MHSCYSAEKFRCRLSSVSTRYIALGESMAEAAGAASSLTMSEPVTLRALKCSTTSGPAEMTVRTRNGSSSPVASTALVPETSRTDDVIAVSDVVPTGPRRAFQDRRVDNRFGATRHARRSVMQASKFSAGKIADNRAGRSTRPSDARFADFPSQINVRDSATEVLDLGNVLVKVKFWKMGDFKWRFCKLSILWYSSGTFPGAREACLFVQPLHKNRTTIGEAREVISLKESVIEPLNTHESLPPQVFDLRAELEMGIFSFELRTAKKTFVFGALTSSSRREYIACLKQWIQYDADLEAETVRDVSLDLRTLERPFRAETKCFGFI